MKAAACALGAGHFRVLAVALFAGQVAALPSQTCAVSHELAAALQTVPAGLTCAAAQVLLVPLQVTVLSHALTAA